MILRSLGPDAAEAVADFTGGYTAWKGMAFLENIDPVFFPTRPDRDAAAHH
jgi:hypothetical protein